MHGICIHDPRHRLFIGIQVGGRNVLLGTDEFDQFCGVAAGDLLQLRLRQLLGIADDSSLGAAERDVHDRALPRHPTRESANFVERNIRTVADPSCSRTASDRVLHAEAGEDLDAAAIHLHWDVDDDFAGGIAKHLPDPRVELEFLCGEVKAGRLRLPGVKFLLLLGGKRYYALFRVGGHRMISLGWIRNVNRRARGDKIWTCLSKLVSIDSRTQWRKCAYLAATSTLITSEIQLLVRSIPGMRKKILSISENDALRVTRHMLLENRGFDVVSTANLRETRNALKSGDFDLVILGISLDGELKREMAILTRKLCANAQILELC